MIAVAADHLEVRTDLRAPLRFRASATCRQRFDRTADLTILEAGLPPS